MTDMDTAMHVGLPPCVIVSVMPIEGNIGAGKSTLINRISRTSNKIRAEQLPALLFDDHTKYDYVGFVPECIEMWTSVGDDKEDLLAAMYEDPRTNGTVCQMNIVFTQLRSVFWELRRIKQYEMEASGTPEKPVNILLITERSVFSGKELFMRMLKDSCKIPASHWYVYCGHYLATRVLFHKMINDLFSGSVAIRTIGVVVLQVTPEDAKKRCEKRGRVAERGQTIDLFRAVDERQREVFALRDNKLVSCAIVWLESNTLANVLTGRLQPTVLQLALLARKKAEPPRYEHLPGGSM
jgi:deoxyadenosine/deoxycytidine kinase